MPSATTTGAGTAKPRSGQPVDDDRPAPVLVVPGRGARRRDAPARADLTARCHLPVRPPSLRSTRTLSMRAALSTALIMSYSVSAATLTAVSASISTPVRSVLRTVAVISTSDAADLEVDVDAGERELMAQRDQFAGPLGGLDAGHPRGRQRVALRQAACGDQRHDLGRRHQRSGRDRGASGDRLRGDVDHVGRAAFVEVGQPTERQRSRATC